MTKKICYLVLCLLFVYQINGHSQKKNSEEQRKVQLPFDRIIQPAGELIIFGDSLREHHALDGVLSPDGQWLVVEERYSVVFINTSTNTVEYTLLLDSISGLHRAMNTYSGIIWKKNNGKDEIWFSASKKEGSSFVVRLKWDGHSASVRNVFTYQPKAPAELALPNELLVRNESGRDYLYVVLNGNNQLLKQDAETGDTIWIANTGVAPYGIAMAQNKLFVTNWGGGVPDKEDKNVAGVPWGMAKVDTTTAGTREGSVSVFNPADGKLMSEIIVGLHPNKIISSPDEKFVYLTNSNSDMVNTIQVNSLQVSESISLTLEPKINSYFGDIPNSLAITSDGKTLYVANGMDNALAVVDLGKSSSTKGKSENSTIRGYIPTAAFPSSINFRKGKTIYVTNLESLGATEPFTLIPGHASVYNSHHMRTSVSVIPVPGKKKLKSYTNTVIASNQMHRLESVKLPPRSDVAPQTVPERIGEPSVIKHVLYIIKENRTYDQVIGDVVKANGDSTLCVFGENVTPNIHNLVDQYQVMDNFFVSGKCSAEGHSWADASIVTDYVEKNVRAWFRSYPHTLNDALVYPSSGFLWDNARRHGVSVRIYGETATPIFNDSLTWSDIYSDFMAGKPFEFKNKSTLGTVQDILSKDYPGYDGHKVPDVLRAKSFIDELKSYEKMDGDSLPQLMIMALPNDHTSGTREGFPTPRAMVADNDYALGKIVDAVSHSKFWKNTAIFVVEDDSQAGWDHVSAYRTVAMVISPYSKLNKVVHTAYNQPSMIRTMEQILGLPPMNIQDAIALPMFDCFSQTQDFTPYEHLKNNIPLDEMNPSALSLTGKAKHFALLSADPQFDGIDSGDDSLFNRILWFSTMGNIPYPAKYKVDDEDDDDDD